MSTRAIILCIIAAAACCLLALGAIFWNASPVDPRQQFQEALAAIDADDFEELNEIEQALRKQPEFEKHASVLRAAALTQTGNYSLALRELASIEAKDDLRQPVLELTGECLYHLGRLSDAEPLMRRLIAEDPDHVDAHRWLGAIYYDLGANDMAIEQLLKVAELAPDDYRPHRLIGLMYFDFERHQDAIEHYRSALELSPPAEIRPDISRELAQSLIATRKFQEALTVLEDTPEDAFTLALRSECLWSLGELEQADTVLDRATELDPENREVLFLRARILQGRGQHAEAIAPLQQVLKASPHDAQVRYQLALVYRQLDQTEKYEEELARWQEVQGKWERLTELNIQAVQNPGDPLVREQLAELCLELGKDDLAVMWKQAADAARALTQGGPPR